MASSLTITHMLLEATVDVARTYSTVIGTRMHILVKNDAWRCEAFTTQSEV